MPSRPVIGLCTALERARWSVWDTQAVLLPRNYVDAVQQAGGTVPERDAFELALATRAIERDLPFLGGERAGGQAHVVVGVLERERNREQEEAA